MTSETQDSGRKFASALVPVMMFILASLSPFLVAPSPALNLDEEHRSMQTGASAFWTGLEQPWGQFGHTPTHNGSMPAHGPEGGPADGSVDDVTVLGTIENPGVNWEALDDGSDLYGSIIADFSASITAPEAAKER
jgi:hypothetical protein